MSLDHVPYATPNSEKGLPGSPQTLKPRWSGARGLRGALAEVLELNSELEDPLKLKVLMLRL